MKIYICTFVFVLVLSMVGCSSTPETSTPNTQATQAELTHLKSEALFLGMKSHCERASEKPDVQGSPRMYTDAECAVMIKQAREAKLDKDLNLGSSLRVTFYNGMQLFCVTAPASPGVDASAKYTVEQCQDMVQQARDINLFDIVIALPTQTPNPSG